MRVAFRQAGFSVIELMVVLLVVGITLAAGVPAFQSFIRSSGLKNGTENLAAQLRLARQMAVSQSVDQIVVWNPDSRQYRIVTDEDGNGVAGVGEPTVGPFTLPDRVDLANATGSDAFTGSQVIFSPDGSASESGSVVLSTDDTHTLTLSVLAPTGQVRID